MLRGPLAIRCVGILVFEDCIGELLGFDALIRSRDLAPMNHV